MPFIPLADGSQTEVSDEDFMYLTLISPWRLTNGYVKGNEDGKPVFMHDVIIRRMGLRKQSQVDHEDGNSLNNKRDNLRLATNAQNQANKGVRKDNSLGVKGVEQIGSKFRAKIKVNKRQIHLGMYDTLVQAQDAYSRAALQYFGSFAKGDYS